MKSDNRALGAYEKFFWLLDQDRPIQFAMTAEIEGVTTVTEWRNALDAVQDRHPLFKVTIQESEDHITTFYPLEDVKIPMRVVQTSANLENELAKELVVPFDNEQLPLIRSLLIHEDHRSVFIFLVHHSIADGMSLTYVFRDLLDAMSGKTLEVLPLPPSMDDLIGLTKNTPVSSSISPATKIPSAHSIYTKEEPKLPFIKRLKLSPELTSAIINRSKEEGTTVNGALCAAFVMAGMNISTSWREQPVRMLCPASVREVLGADENSSLFMTSKIISFDPEEELAFWDMARFARNNLNGITALENITALTTGFRSIVFNGLDKTGAVKMYNTGRTHELLLTNLGRLRYDTTFGHLKLVELWAPAMSAGFTEQVISALTINDSMLLTLTSYLPLEKYLDEVEQIIKNSCGSF